MAPEACSRMQVFESAQLAFHLTGTGSTTIFTLSSTWAPPSRLPGPSCLAISETCCPQEAAFSQAATTSQAPFGLCRGKGGSLKTADTDLHSNWQGFLSWDTVQNALHGSLTVCFFGFVGVSLRERLPAGQQPASWAIVSFFRPLGK